MSDAQTQAEHLKASNDYSKAHTGYSVGEAGSYVGPFPQLQQGLQQGLAGRITGQLAQAPIIDAYQLRQILIELNRVTALVTQALNRAEGR